MNITGTMLGWSGMVGKGDHRSTCFARVVSLRRFRRVSDRLKTSECAINRPHVGAVTGPVRES